MTTGVVGGLIGHREGIDLACLRAIVHCHFQRTDGARLLHAVNFQAVMLIHREIEGVRTDGVTGDGELPLLPPAPISVGKGQDIVLRTRGDPYAFLTPQIVLIGGAK